MFAHFWLNRVSDFRAHQTQGSSISGIFEAIGGALSTLDGFLIDNPHGAAAELILRRAHL
jgi:hypothetical protein